MRKKNIERAYILAQERYADLGVEVDLALMRLSSISISLHCWQGDDVGGFENTGQRTRRRSGGHRQLPRQGAQRPMNCAPISIKALSMIPGKHRLNLHAFYAETSGKQWTATSLSLRISKAGSIGPRRNGMGMDFNPTYFSHPKAADGFTLSHIDKGIRRFLDRARHRCRKIGAAIGESPGQDMRHQMSGFPMATRTLPWIAERPRERLAESLDSIFALKLDPKHNLDAVEAKLFGIGSESYVVGSHEFYLGYAIRQ